MNAPGFIKMKLQAEMKINKKHKIIIIALIIFVSALIFRIFSLGESSETSDEAKWLIRSSNFVNKIVSADFSNSTSEFERHPGIPAAFFMGIFINSFATSNNYEIADMVKPFSWSLKIMNPLTAARIAIAIIGALTCVLFFWFCYKIWGFNTATIAGMLLAFDPFHLSLSRIAHQDVMFMLTFLGAIFFYYLSIKENKIKYRYISGIFFGLAILTKIIGFLIPIIIILWKITIRFKKKEYKHFPLNLHDIIILFLGIFMFFAFYPAMWANPVANFLDHIRMNIEPSGLDDTYFYKGTVQSGVNFDFYYFNSLLRLPEFLIIAVIISFAIFLKNIIFRKKIKNIHLLLLVWFVSFYLIITFFGKMKDRYFLVAWPIILIAGAILINFIIRYATIKTKIKNTRLFLSLSIAPLLMVSSLISIHPNYYMYYNHLIPKNELRWIVSLSRDEGLKQAAEFINKSPLNKKTLSSIDQLQTYLKGKYLRFQERIFKKKISKSANFIVWHLKNEQRRSPETMYEEYVLKLKPIHTIKINDIDAVYIYLNPKKPLIEKEEKDDEI